jgi:hypothetical protein
MSLTMRQITSENTDRCIASGMMLYLFGLAPMVFSALKADVADGLLRKAFPHAASQVRC